MTGVICLVVFHCVEAKVLLFVRRSKTELPPLLLLLESTDALDRMH